MTDQKFPCIVYRRFRDSEPRANLYAQIQQNEAEAELHALGYAILGAHSDIEIAPPFCGHFEPRPAWQNAIDAAIACASAHGRCTLIVLRSDGIGRGDPFLPDESEQLCAQEVDIRICGFSLRSHATTTSLRDSLARFRSFKTLEGTSQARRFVSIRYHEPDRKIVIRVDRWKALVRLYFPNHAMTPLKLRWRSSQRPAFSVGPWVSEEWLELVIPPQSAAYLGSFVQGDPDPTVFWWRFKIGEGRETEVGDVLIQHRDLDAPSLPVNWFRYTPAAHHETDYLWDDAPPVETHRLILRNWTEADCIKIHSMLAEDLDSDVARRCDDEGIELSDLKIFASLGKSGPTVWIMEHKATRLPVGICGLLCDEETSEGVRWQLYCILLRHMQAQGLALEAATSVIATAFNDWNAAEVAMTFAANCDSARRLAERLRMELESSPDQEAQAAHDCGHITFSIDRRQFWRTGRTPYALVDQLLQSK